MQIATRVCATLAAGLALLAAASCASSSGPGSTSATTDPASPSSGTTSASHPLRGIIALGHSALTGENSDPQSPGAPAPQNSWATGTNPAVDSIYQRLAAVDPTVRGHAVNEATGGAPASTLVGQATQALSVVPNPRLVIIEIIGTDIACDGSDSSHYPVFGQDVKAALDLIAKQAPHATILLVSWPGRPLQASKAIIGTAAVPIAQANSASEMCSPFDPDLRLDMKHIRTWTGIIEGYESEQAKACATVPECHTDNGRATHFQVQASYYNYSNDWDWQHYNVTGLAALARFMWPTVAKILNLH
jgi:GDSL-like Lipase/Acylhydrolase